jgi:hypothetical protein
MTTDPRENAFPITGKSDPDMRGLTKREYFAALAMQGLIASDVRGSSETPWTSRWIAELAVEQSNALIAALNGEGQANG